MRLGWSLITSAEYRALSQNTVGLEAIAAAGFSVVKGEEAETFESLDEALG